MKLLWDESGYYCGGDDAGTYSCKVGAKKDGTITALHWHMLGIRNPAMEKTHVSTKIPNILGTQEWALINKGHSMCFRHGIPYLRPAQRHVRPCCGRDGTGSDRSRPEKRRLQRA